MRPPFGLRRALGSALALTPLVLAACVLGQGGESTSESAHTANQLSSPNAAPPMWAGISRTQLDARVFDKTAIGHPVEQRLSAWVDHLDTLARAQIRGATGREALAPKPYVRLIVDREPHIGGQRVVTCIGGVSPDGVASDGGVASDAAPTELDAARDASQDVAVRDANAPLASDAGGIGPVNATLAVMSGKTRSFATNLSNATCLAAPEWSADEGLRWFNSLGGFQLTEHGTFASVDRGSFGEALVAKRVAVQSAAPAINVSSALAAGLSETAMAVMLARELARYHRAHDTTAVNEGEFGFFYERTDALQDPVPLADQATLRSELDKVRLPRFLISGQKIHPRVAPTLLRWINKLDWDQGHPCFEAKRFLQQDIGAAREELAYDWRTSETAAEPLSAAGRSAYLSFEPKAHVCVDAIQLTDGAGPSTFPYGKLTSADVKLPRSWFNDNIDGPLKEATAGTDLRAPLLRGLLTQLERIGKEVDARAPDLEKKLRDNKIGIATAAQEADAIALELSAASGIAPRKVFDAFFELMALEEKLDPAAFANDNANITTEECQRWFDAGFVDGIDRAPRDIYVPPGLAHHPSWCVRMYDLLREAQAHGYAQRPTTGPLDPNTWGSLQSQAESLAPPAPTPRKPEPEPEPALDAGTVTPPSADAGDDRWDDPWEDDGWTPPSRPETSSLGKPTNKAKSTSGGCSVSHVRQEGPAPTKHGLAWLAFGVAGLLARRRRVR